MNAPRTPAEQAADWLIRHDRGLTAAEQDEFHAWLAADPGHGETFARERATWRELDLLAEWRPEHGTEPNPDLLARPHRASLRKIFWLAPLAAAACLTLVWFDRLTSREDGVVERSRVSIQLLLKEQKLKVQGSIQGDELRISGKNRDDLQEAIALFRSQQEKLSLDMQFTNFRE